MSTSTSSTLEEAKQNVDKLISRMEEVLEKDQSKEATGKFAFNSLNVSSVGKHCSVRLDHFAKKMYFMFCNKTFRSIFTMKQYLFGVGIKTPTMLGSHRVDQHLGVNQL